MDPSPSHAPRGYTQNEKIENYNQVPSNKSHLKSNQLIAMSYFTFYPSLVPFTLASKKRGFSKFANFYFFAHPICTIITYLLAAGNFFFSSR